MTAPVVLDVEGPIGDGWDEFVCGTCGDPIEPYEESVAQPIDDATPGLIEHAHTWCAVRNGYRLRWAP